MSKVPTETLTLEVTSVEDEQFKIFKKPIPLLQNGDILIHAAAAPIHPLDILKMEGKMPNLVFPFIPGSECSGIVIDAKGYGLENLIGKKVSAFSTNGSFREHVIVNYTNAIVLPDNVDFEQAACGYIAPITALGLVDLAEDHGAKVIINTAANSTVGKNILKICQKKNINLIGLVNDHDKINEMRNLGCQYVFNTNEKDFESKLTETAHRMNALAVFDCISGSMSGKLFKCLPNFGLLVNYGSLGGKYLENIDATDMRFGKKTLKGFTFFEWIHEQHEIDRRKIYKFVSENIGTLFNTSIAGRIQLENFKEGLSQHRSKLTKGKLIVQLSKLLK